MLVINDENCVYFSAIGALVDRFTDVRLDLPEEVIFGFLKSGKLTRAQMLKCWTRISKESVRNMDISSFTRSELAAVLENANLAKLALEYGVFSELFAPHSLRHAYDHATLEDISQYEIQLFHVIANETVGVEVKRALITKEYDEGRLPITDEQGLESFACAEITPELINQLEMVNFPELVIDPSLFTKESISKKPDLSSRLLLNLCSRWDADTTLQILDLPISGVATEEFFSHIKGPDTIAQTRMVMREKGRTRRGLQYLAAKGRFDKESVEEIIALIEKHGTEADMVTLYENRHLNNEQRALVYPALSVTVPVQCYRRRLFDQLIVNCDTELLNEFCRSYYMDTIMFYYLQTPAAFKRSALWCMEQIAESPLAVEDILAMCHNETFNESECDILLNMLIARPNDDAILRFIMTSGIAKGYKDALLSRINTRMSQVLV